MAELGHVGVNFSNPFHHNLKIKSKTTSSFCFFFFFFFARWISLPSSLHQSHLWFAPPPPPNSQTATNRGLFLERVRCVCIHMMDEGDVSHLSRKGGERWGRDRWRWREQRLKGGGGDQEAEAWEDMMLLYRKCGAEWCQAVRETESFHLRSSLEPQKPADGQLKINRPLCHHVTALVFRQMRDDRDSPIYCTIQLEYSSHRS